MTPVTVAAPGHRRLWVIFTLTVLAAFVILGFFGREVYRQAPPIPEAVRTADGQIVMTRDDILTGQTVWQSTGGQQLGSIWGHGAYQAPDWTADWLHREAVALLDQLARDGGASSYGALAAPEQARLRVTLAQAMRTNTYDAATGVVTVGDERARAIASVALHYSGLFRATRPKLARCASSTHSRSTPCCPPARPRR